ncbi:MAG: CinA family nicotinamide mononucleotide deamidase-related protein [Bacteroidales bacterium]|nr:CinA family nicotinamide mononucleotide deamidase-related protein [Bacteroidales bacterium]
MKASVISVGNELLIGQTLNTNAHWLSDQLTMLGFNVVSAMTTGDNIDDIIESLNFSSRKSQIICLTGGLGPTKDDLTRQALASFMGTELELNHSILSEICQKFDERKRPFTENNIQQAMFPRGSRPLPNFVGIAPGIYAQKDEKHIFAFPGVPTELHEIFQHQATPILQQLKENPIFHFHFLVAGTYESFLSSQLQDFEQSLPPTFTWAYLPSPGYIRLRLSCPENEKALAELLIQEKLLPVIQPYLVSNTQSSLEEILLTELKNRYFTLGTCESCTGGYLAHKITSIPGSSQVYKGSIVSYANEIKEKILHVPTEIIQSYGAVSHETVKIMAREGKSLLNVDVCIAISGIAGPDGGTPQKPVGYVWGAIAFQDQIKTYQFQFGNHRLYNIQWAAYSMMFETIKLLRST